MSTVVAVKPLTTDRLIVREWEVDDADAALAIYGAAEVTRWLTPVMDRVTDAAAMRSVHPMIGSNVTRIHTIIHDHRRGP